MVPKVDWRRVARILSVPTITALILLSIVPGEFRPHTGIRGIFEQVAAYSGTAFLLSAGFGRHRSWQLGLFLVAMASALETAQVWIPGRNAAMVDFGMSSTGAVVGASVGCLLLWRVARRQKYQPAAFEMEETGLPHHTSRAEATTAPDWRR